MSATKNIGASVRARLLNRARADKVDFNLMLTRYGLVKQAASNSKEQFANSPDFKDGLMQAIMDALDALRDHEYAGLGIGTGT